MSQPTKPRRRPWPAVVRARASRLQEAERALVGQLDQLYAHDRRGYDAIMACLRRVVTRQTERGR